MVAEAAFPRQSWRGHIEASGFRFHKEVPLDFRVIRGAVTLKHGGRKAWQIPRRYFRVIRGAVTLKHNCWSIKPLEV